MDKHRFLDTLHEADFTGLFTECGWGAPSSTAMFPVSVGERTFNVREVAQKGFRIYTCEVDDFPPTSLRRTLDAKLRKFSHAYFIIFTQKGEAFHHQWVVPVDAVDKRRLVTVEYADDTHAETLYEKVQGIAFGMDETPAILDVVARVNAQFLVNAADVTKKFYTGFRKQHDAFVKGMTGMTDANHRNWYASVMLNRLMFCYFIQKKGFFMDQHYNPDVNYLQNHLAHIISKKGPDKFFGSFYRGFLKGLFESGLNSPKRSQKFIDDYGRIPYLNGGMFEAHQLEKQYPDIDVPDKVFVELFKFFDEWRWHLDDRIERDGRDINPDVLGYIFEQYINDRAQMGAYYTKEDITEYIGRNCILPFLFEAVKKSDPKPFKPDGEVWKTLKASKDDYIFAAVKKGVELPLPDYIEKGVDTTKPDLRKRRARWNEKATAAYALPTEIWREAVARRQRYAEVLEKITSGKITDIHDFITYNLNIRAFAEDLIRNTSDHLFVRHFYNAIRSVTILDPTCGSGAFLFAALNILEPLYEACLDRMEEPAFAKYFKDELNEIKDKYRSNRQYFIYKNIILRNLYGVDIMHEATEIARLRLFLKMVAVVEADPHQENLGLDPLPDVDFNIRCGNTLVGYASECHLERALQNCANALFVQDELARIKKQAADIADLCRTFKEKQLQRDLSFSLGKKELRKLIADLSDRLDSTLAKAEYQIDSETLKGNKAFRDWKINTQPFHWYSEFYNIIAVRGGFDVIIGNPPYVEWSKIATYRIHEYETFDCGNLYAFVIERVESLMAQKGKTGMIVPHSSICTERMKSLFRIFVGKGGWFSTYDIRPSKLFDGVDQRLLIYILGHKTVLSTKYNRWSSDYRPMLFTTLQFTEGIVAEYTSMSKISHPIERQILKKILGAKKLATFFGNYGKPLYYHNAPRYFLRFMDKTPYFRSEKGGGKVSAHIKTVIVEKNQDMVAACLNSTLFYFWFIVFSNCRDLVGREIDGFCIPPSEFPKSNISKLFRDLDKHAARKTCYYKATGKVVYDEYYPKLSKKIIDEIDELLAKHYGFTEEELDFIINYDIKYRMGDELGGE